MPGPDHDGERRRRLGLIIVVISVASMLTLSVPQRGAELALLAVVASSIAIPLAIRAVAVA